MARFALKKGVSPRRNCPAEATPARSMGIWCLKRGYGYANKRLTSSAAVSLVMELRLAPAPA
jgi:hypothetical protein